MRARFEELLTLNDSDRRRIEEYRPRGTGLSIEASKRHMPPFTHGLAARQVLLVLELSKGATWPAGFLSDESFPWTRVTIQLPARWATARFKTTSHCGLTLI